MVVWMMLIEIDFEISFDRPIAVFARLKQAIKKIVPARSSRPPTADNESQNTILDRRKDSSAYNLSVARSGTLTSTSSSLPSCRSDNLPVYKVLEVNSLEKVAVNK